MIHLKITFFPGGEIRRLAFDNNAVPTLAQLRDSLLGHVQPDLRQAFVFKYCDDEGDYVTIRSEEEWQDAILYTHQSLLRIQVTNPAAAGGPQPQPQQAAPPSALSREHPCEFEPDIIGEQISSLLRRCFDTTDYFHQHCWNQPPQPQQQESPSAASSSNAEPQPQTQQQVPSFDEFLRQNPQFQPYAQMAMQFLQRIQASASPSAAGGSSCSSTAAPPNFEQLMRGLFGQGVPPQPVQPTMTREQQLARLHDLGFLDDETNIVLLERFHGNVERVVQEYVQFSGGK